MSDTFVDYKLPEFKMTTILTENSNEFSGIFYSCFVLMGIGNKTVVKIVTFVMYHLFIVRL